MLSRDQEIVPRGSLLWHYTDFNGLKGILEGQLWASSVAYLNDTEEFEYVLEITTQIASEARSDERTEDKERWKVISTLIKNSLNEVGNDVFVASFSRRQDDLNQWRAYGPSGPKIAIGFDVEDLRMKGKQADFELSDVWYDRERIERTIRATFRNVDLVGGLGAQDLSLLKYVTPELAPIPLDLGLDFLQQIFQIAARCKHESFAAEAEWRLARRISNIYYGATLPKKFRQAGSLVVPYVELEIHKPYAPNTLPDPANPEHWERVESPIRAILVGPSPHPQRLRDAIQKMAERKGIGVPVEASKVPYRNW